jgi:hypothetical protein
MNNRFILVAIAFVGSLVQTSALYVFLRIFHWHFFFSIALAGILVFAAFLVLDNLFKRSI